MQVNYFKQYSPTLQQDMEMKTYGDRGKAAIVFPSSGGRFFEYEDFGMVEACRPWIEAGKLRLICVDGIDRQSWMNESISCAARAYHHCEYDLYIRREVIPMLEEEPNFVPGILATGCSMGAYHAANFMFRYPRNFDSLIALSGCYSMKSFVGDYCDENVYFHSPLFYLPHLEDPAYLEPLRQAHIVICTGQGAWEEEMIHDARAMHDILAAKNIPALVDFWGHDVNHDWPWWRIQMPYFLDRFLGPVREK